jgi:hypothetical protein
MKKIPIDAPRTGILMAEKPRKKKQIHLENNAWVKSMNKAMRLLRALDDEDTFNALSLNDKLEALRVGITQRK